MLLLALFWMNLHAQSNRVAELVIENQKVIWGFDFLNEEEVLFTERSGKMFVTNVNSKKTTAIANVPAVDAGGQGGLLDVKVHPQFAKNKLIYFTYVHSENGKSGTRLSRAKLENFSLTNIEALFTALPLSDSKLHFGSRIAFDGAGHVFIGLGERFYERNKAQDLGTHHGKVIRLKEDGSIPSDNPFVGDSTKKPEVWSYGHRNPQGLFFDKDTKRLWLSEHGPMGGDEVNWIQKGKNYGWPLVSYGREYNGSVISEETRRVGVEDAVHVYVPSIAPSTLHIYKGSAYPEWNNHFFQGALVLQHLNVIEIKDNKLVPGSEERLFQNKYGRIRHVAQSPSGKLYFSTDSGAIYRIK
jgi:glucose/arabinose dehydrogenase